MPLNRASLLWNISPLPSLAHYKGSEIHKALLLDESVAFQTDVKFLESHHAPVIAEFALPDTQRRK
jgi:hypothetical protein